MKVTVVGLGKLGLPLAVQFASSGHEVVGLDLNSKTVEVVNEGREPFPGEFSLSTKLKDVVSAELLNCTNSYQQAIPGSNVVVVVVPLMTMENGTPDFRLIDNAISEIGRYVEKGTLICVETTLPVGTTRQRFKAAIESISKLECGKDFYLAFSPERVLTGRVFADLKKYPKIVGGITQECGEKAKEFYEGVIQYDERPDLDRPNGVWLMSSSEEAEMVKLAETTYRDVNIALSNEMSKYAYSENMDFSKILEATNSQVYCHLHQPGISVGGHCIPVYPRLLTSTFRDAELIPTARGINETMPAYYVQKLVEYFGNIRESNVLVLGLTYRPGVKESAYSGTYSIRDNLLKLGAKCFVADPYYSPAELTELGFIPWNESQSIDFIILHTAHEEYKHFDFAGKSDLKAIVDGRNFLKHENLKGAKAILI